MPGRLAVDFGTSNTVVAAWDDARKEGVTVPIPDFGRLLPAGGEGLSLVPSLIHYADDRKQWVGNQVNERNLVDSSRTFRWMKRYIAHRSPVKVRVDGQEISPFDAGRDFLSTVLVTAATELGIGDEEIALTVPVESFEHYEDWLTGVAEAAGMPRFRLIDEPSAAALGYGAHVQPGHVYLIFDFGGGTLDVAIVLIEEEAAASGRRCRVLGKAGAELGGMTIDQWLFQDVLARNGRSDGDEEVRLLSRTLLMECERAKERLSTYERADISLMNPETGSVLVAEYDRGQLEEILDRNDAFALIDQTVRRAVNGARERGYSESDLQAVLMVGGSSLIPSVRRNVQRVFGRELVKLDRPLDAVARGAAAFVAGVDFYDHIQHDYAVRWANPRKASYEYRPIVRRGTAYPTREPVDRLIVKASYDGQTQLGIAIFEVGEPRGRGQANPVELVFDPSGAARVLQVTADEAEQRNYFWLNEQTPTFLAADPPGTQGEARFEVEFHIDANKRLLITVRDLRTGRLCHQDYPVVKLT